MFLFSTNDERRAEGNHGTPLEPCMYIIDEAKTLEDRKVFEFLFAPQEMGRPFFAPPGVPAERLSALRTTFERTLKDPAFLQDAEKMGVEVQHVGGEAIQALLERIYASPKDVIDRAKAVAE